MTMIWTICSTRTPKTMALELNRSNPGANVNLARIAKLSSKLHAKTSIVVVEYSRVLLSPACGRNAAECGKGLNSRFTRMTYVQRDGWTRDCHAFAKGWYLKLNCGFRSILVRIRYSRWSRTRPYGDVHYQSKNVKILQGSDSIECPLSSASQRGPKRAWWMANVKCFGLCGSGSGSVR